VTFSSSKWPARAPEQSVLLRTYLGGAREPSLVDSSSDDVLVSIASAELRRLLGRLEEPIFAKVFRYLRPQPTLGHVARVGALRAHVRALQGLWLASSGLEGVGIPDCIRQAEATASAVAECCR
jgi:protoporphyrinogen/coproporphyrinogen III oxidase